MNEDQAREGYRAAIQLVSHDAKTVWDSFRSLLAVNTILVGFSGAILKLYPQFEDLVLILGILGIIVCVAWALITARSFDHYKYHFAWVRYYEKDAIGSENNVVQVGQRFAEGSTVDVGEGDRLRMRWVSRPFRVEYLMYVVIVAFLVIYYYVLTAV